jgi:hypothetical protein
MEPIPQIPVDIGNRGWRGVVGVVVVVVAGVYKEVAARQYPRIEGKRATGGQTRQTCTCYVLRKIGRKVLGRCLGFL